MAQVDFAERQLTLTIVYFGALGAGCGTNVRQLHRAQPARGHVELRRIGDTERKDRIWHFSLHLDEEPLPGWSVVLRVASVPGGPDVTLDRSAFLSSLDGVVFVADARAGRIEDNLAAWHDLEASLLLHGIELADLPITFQVNHTDAANARPTPKVLEDLNLHGAPHVEALARQGRGVVESFDRMKLMVLARLLEALTDGRVTLPIIGIPRAARELDEALAQRSAHTDLPSRGIPPRPIEEVVVDCPPLAAGRPLQVVRTVVVSPPDARTTGDDARGATEVRVELLMRPLLAPNGASATGPVPRPPGETTARRTTIILRPADATSDPAATRSHPRPPRPAPWGRVAPPPPAPRERDLPTAIYGVVGILAGLVTGYLLGFVVYG